MRQELAPFASLLILLGGTLLFAGPQGKGEHPKQDPPKEQAGEKGASQGQPKEEAPKEQPKEPPPAKAPEPLWLKILNDIRRAHGLKPVEEDPTLSDGCRKHAEYLSRNNPHGTKEDPATEDAKKGGSTPEGAKAARQSIFAFDVRGRDERTEDDNVKTQVAFDYWMACFFNRVPLLDPGLEKAGWGMVKRICVLDVLGGRQTLKDHPPVISPPDAADGVPRRFAPGGEHPSPLGKRDSPEDTGYPIVVVFPPRAKLSDVRVTFKNAENRIVLHHISTPDAPRGKKEGASDRAIGIIPKEPLEKNMRYTVTVKCRVNDKPIEKTWSFTTQP